MKPQHLLPAALLLLLGACATVPEEDPNGFLTELPEEVLAIVGPNQNVHAVVMSQEDGCYWYQHVNAVEATLLPLLSTEGRRICWRAQG